MTGKNAWNWVPSAYCSNFHFTYMQINHTWRRTVNANAMSCHLRSTSAEDIELRIKLTRNDAILWFLFFLRRSCFMRHWRQNSIIVRLQFANIHANLQRCPQQVQCIFRMKNGTVWAGINRFVRRKLNGFQFALYFNQSAQSEIEIKGTFLATAKAINFLRSVGVWQWPIFSENVEFFLLYFRAKSFIFLNVNNI